MRALVVTACLLGVVASLFGTLVLLTSGEGAWTYVVSAVLVVGMAGVLALVLDMLRES